MNSKVDIQILMPAFNKAKFIEEAINSVLMQKTSYKYQLIVSDDFSNDNTFEIAELYSKKYPNKIILNRNKVNLGCLGNTLKCYKMITSDYFTVLDPDDKWLNQDLIECALSFLKQNDNFSIYFENTILKNDGKESNFLEAGTGITYLEDKNTLFGHTSCCFYRNAFSKEILSLLDSKLGAVDEEIYEGDTFRNVLHLSYAKGFFRNRYSSIYRFNKKGIWSRKSKYERDKYNFHAFNEFSKIFRNHSLSLILKARVFSEKLINYSVDKKDLEIIHNKDNVLKENIDNYIENTKIINSKTISENKLTIVFFFPSKILGGYETYFANAADFLSFELGFNVVYIDYSDGISNQLIKEKNVKRINYSKEKKFYELNNRSVVFFPITLGYEIPEFIGNDIKYIGYLAHPQSIEWLCYRSGKSVREIIRYLKKLNTFNSLYFMCDSCFEAANKFFETEKNYMPVFSYKKNSYKNKNIKKFSREKKIKVAWLGRLDEDKYYAISCLIKNLSKISNIAEIELNIIGTGNFKDKVYQDCIFYKIKTIFHGLIYQENLDKFLIENSDLVFAMGKSVIEAAKLGIPSIITPVYPENDFGDNDYVWSFNAKGYELTLKESHRMKLKGKVITLEKIFDEFLKDDMNSLSKKCLNHYLSYHSVELGISKIIYAAYNAIPIKKYSKILNHIDGIDIFNKLVKKVLNLLRKIKNRKLRNLLKKIRSFFINLINYIN